MYVSQGSLKGNRMEDASHALSILKQQTTRFLGSENTTMNAAILYPAVSIIDVIETVRILGKRIKYVTS